MGLSSLPTPSEGMLTVIVVNTVVSISTLKQILTSILHVVEIRLPSPPDANGSGHAPDPTRNLSDRFGCWLKSVRLEGPDRAMSNCWVCLCRFEPDAVVSRLPCRHVFHRPCVETWLEYDHATCPLCRTHVLDKGAWF